MRTWTPEARARQAELCRQQQPWKKSTGPKTATGKATVSQNARRHGFRSSDWAYVCSVLGWQRNFVKQTLNEHKRLNRKRKLVPKLKSHEQTDKNADTASNLSPQLTQRFSAFIEPAPLNRYSHPIMTPTSSAAIAVSSPVEEQGNRHFRTLPHNLEAEQGLLGALLIDNRAMENIDFLRPVHFYAPAHQRIFEAIQRLIERGQTASPVTLKAYFETDKDLAHVGGSAYLADLAASVVTVVNAADYAQNLYDLHLRRELITLGEEVVNSAYEQTLDNTAVNAIELAENRLFKLAESGETKSGFTTLRDSVLRAIEIADIAYKTDGHVTGVTTGLRDLDEKLGGLHKSDLLILAGRPSMGKTALAVNIAFNAANRYAETGGKEGGIVGFFSLEMSSDQLATRILADQSNISGDAIRKGNISESEFRRFVEASQKLSTVPLYIDDTPALSIGAVRSRARRLKRQHGLSLLIIDYLQLLQGTGSRQSSENRVLEISEITRGLKAIAKELEIPVIALSQLSRAVEQRDDKRPMLSDLRESGSIEQDSDVVMFVYREEYYESRRMPNIEDGAKYAEWQGKMERIANVAEVIVGKQRHGPIGTVPLYFDANFTRFKDLDRVHSPLSSSD